MKPKRCEDCIHCKVVDAIRKYDEYGREIGTAKYLCSCDIITPRQFVLGEGELGFSCEKFEGLPEGETKGKKPWGERLDDCLDHLVSILLCLFAVTEIVVLASLHVALLLAIFGII